MRLQAGKENTRKRDSSRCGGGIRDIKFLLNHPKRKNIQFLIFEKYEEECANNITFFAEK